MFIIKIFYPDTGNDAWYAGQNRITLDEDEAYTYATMAQAETALRRLSLTPSFRNCTVTIKPQ